MKLFIAPVAFTCLVALSACGGDSQADASVERQAASSVAYTLCVKNDSSRTISSIGDGSPSQPEGFVVRPGDKACASATPGTKEIIQSMMSDVGPSWTTRYALTPKTTAALGTFYEEVFSTCGRTWSNETSISASLSCSGNPFRVKVNFEYNGAASTANVTFTDQ
jgi:hypothetical protein